LLNAGYGLLRFTAADMQRPDLIVAQVRGVLLGRCTNAGLPANLGLAVE
jgi:hypothetical protein